MNGKPWHATILVCLEIVEYTDKFSTTSTDTLVDWALELCSVYTVLHTHVYCT